MSAPQIPHVLAVTIQAFARARSSIGSRINFSAKKITAYGIAASIETPGGLLMYVCPCRPIDISSVLTE